MKRILVVVLSLLLFATLLGANTAVAVDRGPLDADYMKETAHEAGLYGAIADEATNQIDEQLPPTDELPIQIDVQAIVAEAITEEYIRNQTEPNVDRIYAHLHGEEEALEIVIDTRPLKENLVSAIVNEVEDTDIRELGLDELGNERLANLTESEAQFEAEREAVRAELRRIIVREAGVDPAEDFNNDRLARLAASESSYEDERRDFRNELKDQLIAETGLDPDDDFGSERLANLAASESSYEDERERFKEEQKEQIQEETDRELTEPELEAAYQERKDDIREALHDELTATYVTDDLPDPVVGPAEALVDVAVDGLMGDTSYDEFLTEYDAVKANIDDGIDQAIDDNMPEIRQELRAEIDDEISVPADAPEELESVVDDLTVLVVDAYTTDLTYDEFSSRYDQVKVDFDASLDVLIDERSEEIQSELRTQLLDQLNEDDVPPGVESSLTDAIDLAVEALTTDMSYETFMAELDALKTDIAENMAQYVLEEEGDVPDEFVLTEELGESEREALASAQGAVSILELLTIALPIVGVALAGGIYFVAGSTTVVTFSVGLVSLFVGGLSAALARIAPAQIVELAGSDIPATFADVFQSVVWALFAPLWGQSLALTGAGVLATGVGIALWQGVGPFGTNGAASAVETGAAPSADVEPADDEDAAVEEDAPESVETDGADKADEAEDTEGAGEAADAGSDDEDEQ